MLATGEQLIIYNHPIDYYWGCRKNSKGKPKFRQILMNIRDVWQSNLSKIRWSSSGCKALSDSRFKGYI